MRGVRAMQLPRMAPDTMELCCSGYKRELHCSEFVELHCSGYKREQHCSEHCSGSEELHCSVSEELHCSDSGMVLCHSSRATQPNKVVEHTIPTMHILHGAVRPDYPPVYPWQWPWPPGDSGRWQGSSQAAQVTLHQ